MITLKCPHCEAQFGFPNELRGSRVRCQSCDGYFTVGATKRQAERNESEHRLQVKPGPLTVLPMRSDRSEAPRPPSSKAPVIILLLLAGFVALFFVAVGIGGLAWLLGGNSATVTFPGPTTSGGTFADGDPISGDESPLRYAWKGGPHVYKVRVELDQPDHLEIHESTFVVNVGTPGRKPGKAREQKGSGTGFVVNSNGWLVTCNHVVADATKVDVILGGRTYPARIVARNAASDLAVLRINAQNLPALSLGDSNTAEVGQEVWALGFPLSDVLGTNLKATRGTISGKNGRGWATELQVDASVNPGNSGGPLVSDTGIVVGVTKAKLAGEAISNVGFATTSNEARRWLAANKVPFETEGWTTKLDGPTLVKRVAAATALIQVNVDPSASSNASVLTCRGSLPMIKVPKPGANFSPPVKQSPRVGVSRVEVDAFGHIESAAAGIQLPCLLGDVVGFMIDIMPDDNRDSWESSNQCSIEEVRGAGPVVGSSGFPELSRAVGPARFGAASVRAANEKVTFTRLETNGDVIRFRKDYELKVPPANDPNSFMSLTGRGFVTFDCKLGLPRAIEFDGMLEVANNRTNIRQSVKATYSLLDGAARDSALRPAPSAPPSNGSVIPKTPAENEDDQLPPIRPIFDKTPRVFLSDLQEFGVKNGPWPYAKNGQIGNGKDPIKVAGKEFPRGLGMHPPDRPGYAAAKFRLGKQAALLRAQATINDNPGFIWDGVYFEVWGDGKKLFESEFWKFPGKSIPIEVKLDGVDVLELRVRCHDKHMGAHAVWLDPRLLQKADTLDK